MFLSANLKVTDSTINHVRKEVEGANLEYKIYVVEYKNYILFR